MLSRKSYLHFHNKNMSASKTKPDPTKRKCGGNLNQVSTIEYLKKCLSIVCHFIACDVYLLFVFIFMVTGCVFGSCILRETPRKRGHGNIAKGLMSKGICLKRSSRPLPYPFFYFKSFYFFLSSYSFRPFRTTFTVMRFSELQAKIALSYVSHKKANT